MQSFLAFIITLLINNTVSLYSYTSMNCYNDVTYVNSLLTYHDNMQTSYFINGVNYSTYGDRDNQDRIWKWRYCQQTSAAHAVQFISTSMETVTPKSVYWERNCTANSALIGLTSNYDSIARDRAWSLHCGHLNTNKYILTSCTDTGGYVNGLGVPFSFYCHLDGVITSIYSTWALFNSNDYRDRYFGFRCCRITNVTDIDINPTLSFDSYTSMNSYNDATYVNELLTYHDNTKAFYFINGINDSVYGDRYSPDRIWKWRYCQQASASVQFISTSIETVTPKQTFWERNCTANSALIGITSNYDSIARDRAWSLHCGHLDTNKYILTSCADTGGYVNGLGVPFSFFCHPDGVITSIYSIWALFNSNDWADRYFGFRCCRITDVIDINPTIPENPTMEPTLYPTIATTISINNSIHIINECDASRFNVTIFVHLNDSNSLNTLNLTQLIYNKTLLYLEEIGSYSIIELFCEESVILIYDDSDDDLLEDNNNLEITLYATNDGSLETDSINDDEYGDQIEDAIEDEYDINVDVDVDVEIIDIIDIETTDNISKSKDILSTEKTLFFIYLIIGLISLLLIIAIIGIILCVCGLCYIKKGKLKYKNIQSTEQHINSNSNINRNKLEGTEMTGINLQSPKNDNNPVLLDNDNNNNNKKQYQYHGIPGASLPKQPVIQSDLTLGYDKQNELDQESESFEDSIIKKNS